jgi:hypothetical protein
LVEDNRSKNDITRRRDFIPLCLFLHGLQIVKVMIIESEPQKDKEAESCLKMIFVGNNFM